MSTNLPSDSGNNRKQLASWVQGKIASIASFHYELYVVCVITAYRFGRIQLLLPPMGGWIDLDRFGSYPLETCSTA
jgi:hypothetical protein